MICDECGRYREGIPAIEVRLATQSPATFCGYDCLAAWAIEMNAIAEKQPSLYEVLSEPDDGLTPIAD